MIKISKNKIEAFYKGFKTFTLDKDDVHNGAIMWLGGDWAVVKIAHPTHVQARWAGYHDAVRVVTGADRDSPSEMLADYAAKNAYTDEFEAHTKRTNAVRAQLEADIAAKRQKVTIEVTVAQLHAMLSALESAQAEARRYGWIDDLKELKQLLVEVDVAHVLAKHNAKVGA